MTRRAPVSIRIDGTWLDSIVRSYAGIKITHTFPFGCWGLTATLNVDVGDLPPPFLAGRPRVEAIIGSSRCWLGTLDGAEVWASGQLSASGLARQAETAVATVAGGATLDPSLAIFYASSRGAFQVGTLETWPLLAPDTATDLNYVAALLDASALARGRRWLVDANGLLYSVPDPTVPTLFVAPGSGELPVTTQVQCTAVWLAYTERVSLATRYVWVQAPNGGPLIERIADVTSQPSMTTTEASALASRILAQVGPQQQFSGGITVPISTITNGHGVEVDPALVRAGAMVRLEGARDGRNGRPYTDFVCGESIWDVDAEQITLTPVEAVPTSFEGIIQDLGGQAQ